MATINFLYRSTKDKANLHLRLLYRFNEIDFVIGANTKFEVSKDYWSNQHKQRVFKKTNNVIEINKIQVIKTKQNDIDKELNNIENHILKAFNLFNTGAISKEWLQTEINLYYNPPQEAIELPSELIKYFDYFIKAKKNEITIGTLKKYNATKNLLERYQNTKNAQIQIADVHDAFKNDFDAFCLKNNYAINTTSKNLKIIKTVCNHAKHNGLNVSHQLATIKTPQHKTESVYLNFDELTKIENIDKRRLNDNYNNAKDWLIISCFTAQRVSDFMRFDKSMIRYEKNKQSVLKPFIEFKQVKTNKLMIIPLHPKVIEILEKRNGEFPQPISDAKYNLFIKQVCRIAGINEIIKGSKLKNINEAEPLNKQFRKEVGMYKKWELVTSHIGRKSFCTNFYGTIPTTYLISMSGHKTEQNLLTYLVKSNKDLAMELTNYF